MHVPGESSPEWGMLMLMGAEETRPRYADALHYILYIVGGRAILTIGDGYNVPCTDVLLADGFVAKVPRGNHYIFMNANAMLPFSLLYYRFCAAV